MDVELNGLCASTAARIGNGYGEGDGFIRSQLLLVSGELTQLESGVTQTVTKSKERSIFTIY